MLIKIGSISWLMLFKTIFFILHQFQINLAFHALLNVRNLELFKKTLEANFHGITKRDELGRE